MNYYYFLQVTSHQDDPQIADPGNTGDGGDGDEGVEVENPEDGECYDGDEQESEVPISVVSNGDECADNFDEFPSPEDSSTPVTSNRPRKTLGPRKSRVHELV